MLDGSITPFKVRSSITIASLKAKFEPWQPMKGRALLHHNVQLDDRATLSSVPGVKDGTILRVDKQVSLVKNKITGKKTVMSGPVGSAVDDDVVESIEWSGHDEEASSENERRISSSKRKRPSMTSATTMADFIDDNIIADSSRGRAVGRGEIYDDSPNIADTNLSNSAMALHIAKKEKTENAAREQADVLASEGQKFGHPLHSFQNIFTSPFWNPIENPTAKIHMPKTTEAVSSPRDVMEDDETTVLAGINAAAPAKTERPPLHFAAAPEEDISARRCDACGRACGCDGAASNGVMPVEKATRGHEAASTNGNSNRYQIANGILTSQRAESSWTGM